MGQQDDDFLGDYLDTVNSDSDSKGSQDGTLPLPSTDDAGGGGSGIQLPDVTKEISDSGDEILKESYKKSGENAATRDFQQAHSNGWEYDADAMKKQIGHLEDLRDNKLNDMQQLTKSVIDIPPPAKEKVSEDFIEEANKSGESHNEQFEKYREYVKAYIETLKKIDKAYQNEDEEAAQEILSKEI